MMQTSYRYIVWSGILCCLLQGCRKELQDNLSAESRVPVDLHLRADGVTGEEGSSAQLLFWTEAEFHNNLMKKENSSQAKPLFTVAIDQAELNSYTYESGNVYPTSQRYSATQLYHATGYAPTDKLEVSKKPDNIDYTTLKIKKGVDAAQTDFLACDGNPQHTGSVTDPFTAYEHQLEFRHLTPRILFQAKRDKETMWGKISVNDVKITVHAEDNKLYVPTKFVLHTNVETDDEQDQCTYLASGFERITKDIELKSPTKDFIPASETPTEIASCYVFNTEDLPKNYDPFGEISETAEEVNLQISVSAQYYIFNGDNDPIKFEKPEIWNNLKPVEITTTTGGTFYPGYQYVVTLIFKRDNVTLQAEQVPWDRGGIHYIPITPKKEGQ